VRRNAEQVKTIEQLQVMADRSEARFRAWAKEMANREDERADRDNAQPCSPCWRRCARN
jgi:hypothetical protein